MAFLGVAAIIWSFYVSIVILWGYLGLTVLIFGGGLPYWAQTVGSFIGGMDVIGFDPIKTTAPERKEQDLPRDYYDGTHEEGKQKGKKKTLKNEGGQ